MSETEAEPRLINNWDELADIKDSETHRLELEDCCGWIINKKTEELEYYLSTHTFYDSKFQRSTEVLQGYGFNVQIKNWHA